MFLKYLGNLSKTCPARNPDLNLREQLCCAIENKKKIDKAVINMLQLATRKNLIQMSLDVITLVTVIINY
jgi:hypothetical protein